MNTNFVFPFAALAVLATATAAASFISFPVKVPVDGRIVDLPVVTVRASPQDAAYYRARRIVDLPRITVYPEPADQAALMPDSASRTSYLPVSAPQASVLDRQATASPNALAGY